MILRLNAGHEANRNTRGTHCKCLGSVEWMDCHSRLMSQRAHCSVPSHPAAAIRAGGRAGESVSACQGSDRAWPNLSIDRTGEMRYPVGSPSPDRRGEATTNRVPDRDALREVLDAVLRVAEGTWGLACRRPGGRGWRMFEKHHPNPHANANL